MRQTIFLFSLICSFIVQGQTISYQTINIEPNLSLQNYEHFKRLVLNSNDSEADFIADFNFEWGYHYKLKVKVIKLKSELSDGSRYDFILDKVISKTKVADSVEFYLTIDPSLYYYVPEEEKEKEMNKTLKTQNDSTYLYFDQVEIEVPENLRLKFKDVADGNSSRRGVFVFVNPKRIRLIRFN